MAEYGSMLAVSLLASILFLGGWHGPVPVGQWLGLTFAHGFWYGFAGNVLGTANILTKGIIGVTVMMWVRWTLPRLRIDQVITTCLKYCVPISAITFLGATWWQYAMPDRAAFGIKRMPYIELAEQWPATNDSKGAAPVTQPTTRAQSGGGTSRLADNSRTD